MADQTLLQRLEAKITWLESEIHRLREHKLTILQKELAKLEGTVKEPVPPDEPRRRRKRGRRAGWKAR